MFSQTLPQVKSKLLSLLSEFTTKFSPLLPKPQSKIKSELSSKLQQFHITPPKYPIVLCHGLFGYHPFLMSNWIPVFEKNYFIGVTEALKEIGCQVYIPRVSPTGSIEERANELKKFLREEKINDVHLVCHSMGGLDARFLITHLPCSDYRVLSLTTISTPHRGSPFADFLREQFGIGSKGLEELMKFEQQQQSDAFRVLIDKIVKAVDAPAYGNLTTKYLTQIFNPSTPNDEKVLYCSYGGYIPRPSIVSYVKIPWEIVYAKEGDNDGIVSIYSSRWGEFVRAIEANHFHLKRLEHGEDVSLTNEKSYAASAMENMIQSLVKLTPSLPDAQQIQVLYNFLNQVLPQSLAISSSNENNPPAYIKRLNSKLDRIGPNSELDYRYGLDHEFQKPAPSKDPMSIYLEIISRLSKKGM